MNANIDEDRTLTEGAAASRRTLLRGMLLAGFSLFLPAALMGCDSQARSDAGDAGGGPNPSAADADPTMESAKLSQESVAHQTQPKGEQQCDGCLNFVAASNTCQVVEGTISPDNWSNMWTPRV